MLFKIKNRARFCDN